MKRVTILLLCAAAGLVHAEPRVVSDEACPRYAVDIAAFATCDGDRVAGFERSVLAEALLPESAVPVTKRSFHGLYVDATQAYRLRHGYPQSIVLVDVRSRLEAGLTGQPAATDLHVPFLETALPLQWDHDLGSWAMTKNAGFAVEVAQRLGALGIALDTPLLLLCRSGERSARAADALAALGFTRTISVVDGFEGDVGPDGRRAVNGWKNAGLPWAARPLPALVYGAQARAAVESGAR